MRVGRVVQGADNETVQVIIEGDNVFELIGDLFDAPVKGDLIGTVADLRLAPPVQPGKIVCVGLNYLAHVTENDPNRQVPDEPVIFMKPPSALIGPNETIRIANPENRTDYEAELAVVMGRKTRSATPDDALSHVFGYTCANDVSDRILQRKDTQWIRAKGFDTYCPLGPWIETELEIDAAIVSSFVNGEPRQSQSVSTMIFPVSMLISFISGVMTLDPGDVILTGTPEGVGPLQPGDTVEISVTGIGTLTNQVE